MTDKKCPLVKGKCWEHKCMFYTQLIGSNPNTGQPTNEFGCAISWLPILLIEGAQQTRQAGAAIESFRNEMVRANGNLLTTVQMKRLADGG